MATILPNATVRPASALREPGTGLGLRGAYDTLKAMLEKCRTAAEAVDPERAAWIKLCEESDERARIFRRDTKEARARKVLTALGDDKLTAQQVAEKAIGIRTYHEQISVVLRQLQSAGEIDREEIAGYRGGPKPRWLYFRRVELRGGAPIVDLERTFHETEQDGE